MKKQALSSALLLGAMAWNLPSMAGENLLGYTAGAEPLPKGALEFYQIFVQRSDKGQGSYTALDSITELEYGFTNRFSGSAALIARSVDTNGLIIGGYLPEEKSNGLTLSGIEGKLKYSFLTPALDDIGLATAVGFEYDTIDKHSGQDKDTLSITLDLMLQKYFMDAQLVWLANIGMESTHAKRASISGINDEEMWPTVPEMEIGTYVSTGLSYRFAPNWSVGAEAIYEQEHETEVGQERWSVFAGPSIHYGGRHFWSTLTYLPQISGGGESYDGQTDDNLHLIEKTKQEIKFKIGYNF
ncbi:hypothetical protein QCB45_01750 [Thiomicrorhabdus sp. ZW0627]|uniref:DUF6662 family protein n=1 Tax=Thiomicrorhabdus sp. ZW0627 TaxID=3039774 RepID=UPI002436E6B3|nr:DUF6662 family protein [Thiomicrorhabdus sp. ZW0627]MDG6773040.1 hypothetical protein [Thiomicrorhabdus sp. ZW0627]